MKPGWDQVDVPEFLQTLGDRAFVALGRIADHGESADVDDELDAIRRDYATLYDDSLALVEARVTRARNAAARKAVRKATAELADQQPAPAQPTRLQHLRSRGRATAGARMKKLVLITGTGRSGTSTMSGTLHHLGLYVPGPYLGCEQVQPQGLLRVQVGDRVPPPDHDRRAASTSSTAARAPSSAPARP